MKKVKQPRIQRDKNPSAIPYPEISGQVRWYTNSVPLVGAPGDFNNLIRQQSVQNTSRLLDHETFLRTFKGKETSDAELIEEYNLNHNEQAFEELYRRYKRKMLSYIYAIIHDNEESRDVLQNAWELVIHTFRKENYEVQCFESWFKSICYREARLWKLRKQRFLHGGEYMPDKPDQVLNAEQRLINAETETLLNKALDSLEEDDRQVVILHALEQRSFREIGIMLDKNTYTIRSQYYRATIKMSEQVNETH